MAYPWPCLTGTFNISGWKVVAGATSNPGSTATTLRYPNDVYVDTSEYIFVADSLNHRIQRFAPGKNRNDHLFIAKFRLNLRVYGWYHLSWYRQQW